MEKEIKTWVEEMGVISGGVRISEALMRVSCEVPTCSIIEGSRVAKEKITSTGMRTEKADFKGIPQSL